MTKFLIWIFFIYIVWKLFEAFLSPKGNSRRTASRKKPSNGSPPEFSNIEDADFEDITPKPPAAGKKPS